jgi:hypothetical protein
MCKTRSGVLTVPNVPNKNMAALLAAAERHAEAVASLGDDEKLIGGSVRLNDGPGSPRLDDDSVMEFHYTYTVMVPGCSGWSMPLT